MASFAGAGREKAAEEHKRRLEAGNELKVLLVPSEDGKYLRAIVGPYPDRQAADTVCKELRKRTGFEDCFVKPL